MNSIYTNHRNPNFTSLNKEIRFADDIARAVNRNYPRISSTRMECLEHSEEFAQLIENLDSKNDYIRILTNIKLKQTRNPIEKIKILLNSIKNYRFGNCGESAELSLIAAKLNGIKDCSIRAVEHPDGYGYDHAVVYVENGKKPYIIDSWLGFADYVPNTIKRFQKEFRKNFWFELMENEQMTFQPTKISTIEKLLKRISPDELKKLCPELFIRK